MSELLQRILTFGLLGAALVGGAIYFYNEGATPTLAGEITEVRTLAMDEASSVAVVNFAGTNTSDRIVFIQTVMPLGRALDRSCRGGGRFPPGTSSSSHCLARGVLGHRGDRYGNPADGVRAARGRTNGTTCGRTRQDGAPFGHSR